MKILFVISALLIAHVFGQASDIRECFAPVLDGADTSSEEMRLWMEDFISTSERLRTQRQRCDDIPRDDPPTAIQDRLIQNCMNAWNLMFAYETARLMADLNEINGDLAREVRDFAPNCFGTTPDAIDPAFMRKVLKNIF